MKDLMSLIAGLALLLVVLFMIHDSKADDDAMKITQHLYDQAIAEIEQGNKDFGCYILRDALLASHDIDDGYETYTSIWDIGTKTCNWINNPSTVETKYE